MKQVRYTKYGKADVLKVVDVKKPKITGKGQILVKVLYSSLNAIDWKNRKGSFRFVSGMFKPRTMQGFDVYGELVEKSQDVSNVNVGDKIVGQLGNFQGGSLSEFVIMNTRQFIKVPDNLSGKELAGLPMAGTTAWQALFVNAKLQKGHKVLINGGSSGVGHLAIQIAKANGAEVTSVSSTKNLDFCKSLGADKTVDYTNENFTTLNEKFDIIFDVVFNASLSKVRNILSPKGIYIGTTPSPRLLIDMLRSKQAKFVAVKPNTKALTELVNRMQQKRLKVCIDKVYNLSDIVDAHKYMERSRTRGKLIIKIDE